MVEGENKNLIESPCLNCTSMVQCKKMCYERLLWGMFDASKDDEEIHIYGNNLRVRTEDEIVKFRKVDVDVEVKQLLEDFKRIYNREVITPIKRELELKAELENYNKTDK